MDMVEPQIHAGMVAILLYVVEITNYFLKLMALRAGEGLGKKSVQRSWRAETFILAGGARAMIVGVSNANPNATHHL